MLENKSLKNLSEDDTKKYAGKIESLKNALKLYRSFGKENADLKKSLSTSLEFLKNYSNDEMTLVDLVDEKEDAKIVYDPNDIEITKNPKFAAETIEEVLEEVTMQVSQIEETLKIYEKKLTVKSNLKEYPYDLFSIIINPKETENCYVFIYDFEKKLWRKYCDEEITEEESFPTVPTTDVCALIYLSRNHQKAQTRKTFKLSTSKLIKTNTDCYTSPLPCNVKREVFDDNLKLDNEIIDKNACLVCSKALDLYQKRFDKLTKNKKLFDYSEWNLTAYIEQKGFQFYKYVLLDSIMKQLHEVTMPLSMIEENSKLWQVLNEVFIKQCNSPPKSLRLSRDEYEQLENIKTEFKNQLICKKVQYEIMINLISENWENGLKEIDIYFTKRLYYDKVSKKIMEDVLKLLSLRFVSIVTQNLMIGNFPKTIVGLKYITHKIVKFLDTEDNHIKHTKKYLNFIFANCGEHLPKEIAGQFKSELNNFSGCNNDDIPISEVL